MKHHKWMAVITMLLAASLVIGACTPAADDPTEPAAEPPPAAEPTEAVAEEPTEEPMEESPEVIVDEPELIMLTNVGAKETVDEVIAPVILEKYGVELLVEEKISSEQITTLIAEKGNPEVSLTCGLANFDMPIALENELFAPLDYDKLPNAEALFDIATADPYGEFGVAWNGAVTWIQYYTPIFEENGWDPPTSYAEFADPKYAGHVGLTSATSGVGIMFVENISKAAGAERGDITPGLEYAASLVESGQVHSFPTRSSEVNELMANGEIWIANQFSGGTTSMIADGGPVSATLPEEGTGLFTEACHLVAGASNADVAHEVINMMIGPEFQQAYVEQRPVIMFRPVDIPELFADVIPATAEEIAKISSINLDDWTEFRQEWRDLWFREVEVGGGG